MCDYDMANILAVALHDGLGLFSELHFMSSAYISQRNPKKPKPKQNKAQIKKAQIKKAEGLVVVTIFLV